MFRDRRNISKMAKFRRSKRQAAAAKALQTTNETSQPAANVASRCVVWLLCILLCFWSGSEQIAFFANNAATKEMLSWIQLRAHRWIQIEQANKRGERQRKQRWQRETQGDFMFPGWLLIENSQTLTPILLIWAAQSIHHAPLEKRTSLLSHHQRQQSSRERGLWQQATSKTRMQMKATATGEFRQRRLIVACFVDCCLTPFFSSKRRCDSGWCSAFCYSWFGLCCCSFLCNHWSFYRRPWYLFRYRWKLSDVPRVWCQPKRLRDCPSYHKW